MENRILTFFNFGKHYFYSKQPSFGKLNIPKPNSVTSERRTSFFGARYVNNILTQHSVMFLSKRHLGVYCESVQH